MTPYEIVIDTCKKGGSPLSEAQEIFVAGSVAFLIEKAVQDEREACALECIAFGNTLEDNNGENYAEQIRARSK